MDDIYARLHPQVGDAAPSEGTITADFRGHIIVDFVVPEGGPGDVEVGAHAQGCDSSGKCSNIDVPFDLVGIGPPPDAAPGDLVTATFHDFIGDIVADRPFPVTVDVNSRGQWQIEEVPLPQVLQVVASRPGEPQLAGTTILRGGDPGAPYSGHLTIPGLGDASLSVVIRGIDGTDQVLPGEAATVTVIHGGRPSESPGVSSPAPVSGGDSPPVVPLVAIAVLAIIVVFAYRRILRSR